MPFTPFHFGLGLLIKSAAKKFSFLIFVFSQIIMDLEPLYFMLRQDWPAHRIFHTFIGCNIAAVISIFLGKPLCELGLKILNFVCRSHFETRIEWRAVTISALIGAYSHVLLDGLMHQDMKPFWPFSVENPMLGLVSHSSVHIFCIAGAVFFILKRKSSPAN